MANEGESEELADPTFAGWFTEEPGREIFEAIPVEFFEDEFNLIDICQQVGHFDTAIDLILADEPPGEEVLADREKRADLILLYELVHQRYIMTRAALHTMYGRFVRGDFGQCPRTMCSGEHVLPLGMSTFAGQANLKLYCPRCQDIYTPPSRRHARLDGVGFGPTFAHLLLLQHREQMPPWSTCIAQWPVYEPHIFGFRVHRTSPHFPCMRWLRKTPDGYR